ncbi:formate dehydrogenase accessory protein FdhE [Diaphorobacter sp. HDW4A]|uniref:formate dehydrogenase accessory protein FdhE n=1 Tax=Diaphorobacter sp. HDW4A TaxID=2714924 RepID=UPI00140D9D29|nr:formate dehydrogenase accessory protein FdhE [Diaphorobacter sp. HDW4A]QIL78499.1 formate dehydrogenase accessory protein FdhE [Diaphorobacter sp. HDW4A]
MSRILQPGEIESLDRTNPQRIRLPQPAQLFAERAARLEQKADGNPIADYLRFVAQIVRAQQKAAASVQTAAPDAVLIAQAQEHSMPLLPAASHIDPVWQDVLVQLLDELDHAPHVPDAVKPMLQSLHAMDAEDRNTLARRVLVGLLTESSDLAAAPVVMAALQVTFADRASRLQESDVPYTDPASICPVCATAPVASVIRIGGRDAGLRYLHCGTCATEWHMVRVKCTHCESTKGVRYQKVDGGDETVLAETCDVCHTYRKIANQEKDPFAEPLADDLATLMLDLLMSETDFARASVNPLLPMTETDATPDDHNA